MKKTVLIFGIFFLSASLFSQSLVSHGNVPREVRIALVENFEEVDNIRWYKDDDDIYEARFRKDNMRGTAFLSADGSFISSTLEVNAREIPGAISMYISDNYSNKHIDKVELKQDSEKNITYNVEISRHGINQPVTKLIFDFSGTLKKVIEPEKKAIIEEEEDFLYDEKIDDIEEALNIGEPLNRRELPPAITNHIETNYEEYRFDSATFADIDDHGVVYEIRLRRRGYREFMHVYYDLWGSFIKEMKF